MNTILNYCADMISSPIVEKIKLQLKEKIGKFKFAPKLCIISVGDDSASQVYIKNKIKLCRELGIDYVHINCHKDIHQSNLIGEIKRFNERFDVHGIIVQQPLPPHLDTEAIVNTIDPRKDVDGFTKGSPFIPATPKGICTLLKEYKVETCDRNIVIIGRSDTVGRPLANLLSNKEYNGNVTLLHSRTSYTNMIDQCHKADIIIACCGIPKFVTDEFVGFISPIIIDVGIHRDENNKLCGDVDYNIVKGLCRGITPVPGGVGPMTVISLMENTVEAYERIMEEE